MRFATSLNEIINKHGGETKLTSKREPGSFLGTNYKVKNSAQRDLPSTQRTTPINVGISIFQLTCSVCYFHYIIYVVYVTFSIFRLSCKNNKDFWKSMYY